MEHKKRKSDRAQLVVKHDTRDTLKQLGKKGETYEDIIKRLIATCGDSA